MGKVTEKIYDVVFDLQKEEVAKFLNDNGIMYPTIKECNNVSMVHLGEHEVKKLQNVEKIQLLIVLICENVHNCETYNKFFCDNALLKKNE